MTLEATKIRNAELFLEVKLSKFLQKGLQLEMKNRKLPIEKK